MASGHNSVCLNISSPPSFAPVVTVTSVSGFNARPKEDEYASAMAFLRRGRPYLAVSLSPSLFTYCDQDQGRYLRGGVLVTIHSIQGLLSSIEDELGRIVTTVPRKELSVSSSTIVFAVRQVILFCFGIYM